MIVKRIVQESTIDYRKKFGPVIFTSGCNFRCKFCHNPELVVNKELDEGEIDDIYNKLHELKIKTEAGWYNGVCITGGEPTIHSNLPDFASKFKMLGLSVKIDTNGSNPEMLKKLIDGKAVDYIAMDIKTSKELYNNLIGVNFDLSKIEKSIKILGESGIQFEFRTTFSPIIKERVRWMSEEEIEDMARWVKSLTSKGKWILQSFVSRDKLVEDNYCKEKLDLSFHETPKLELEKARVIIEKYFPCEII